MDSTDALPSFRSLCCDRLCEGDGDIFTEGLAIANLRHAKWYSRVVNRMGHRRTSVLVGEG